MSWRFLFAAPLLLLSACVVGPKYATPTAPVPPSYKEASASNTGDWKPAQPGDVADRGKWWEKFDDPQLNALEEKLNHRNQNVAAAAAQVQAAKAMVREARAQYIPTATANPGVVNSRISTGFGKPLGIVYSAFSLPFEASWEPDLFGRVRNTANAAAYSAQAAAADLANVRLSAQAELAADYYQLRAQDQLRRLLDSAVGAYQEALELTAALDRAGAGNDEAVAQAEAQLKAARAQATNLGVLRAQYEHAIAVLCGEPASALSIAAEKREEMLPAIPAGIPSELLQRRPDIAASERAVAQANAQIGLAQTAFYPSVTLSASAGLTSLSMANWFTWPSRVWSVGPALAQTLFDGGKRRAAVQQYQAAYDQTAANYRQTVLTAFQQVEDNLAALRILAETIEEQDTAIASAGRSLEEAQVRYRAGLDPYLNVISAQVSLLNNQQAAVNFGAQRMIAGVQLIKALGGGWDVSQLPSVEEVKAKPSGVKH